MAPALSVLRSSVERMSLHRENAIRALEDIAAYGTSLPITIEAGEKPPLEDMIGRLFAGQIVIAEVLAEVLRQP